MKLTSIFLLALLALAVVAQAIPPTHSKTASKSHSKTVTTVATKDDWNEHTDIVRSVTGPRHSHHRTEEASYKAKTNETVIGEYEETDGVAATWVTKTEHKLEVINGKIVNTTYTQRYRTDSHKKVQRIRTIIHTKHKISNVLEVVKGFVGSYGNDLTAAEFTLLNTIITTDENKFKMDYEIKQVRTAGLDAGLEELAKMFTVPTTSADIAHWHSLIVNNCSKFYQVIALDTSSVEVHRPDLWVVKTEVLMATCGDKNGLGYQLFAWSASKSGAYHKGQYSVANSETVDALVTRWLYSNMKAMLDCKHHTESSSSKSQSSSKSSTHTSRHSKTTTHIRG